MLVVAEDRDGMTPELMARFDQLPYRKLMYVAKPVPYDWAVYLPQFKNQPYVGIITEITNLKGVRHYETEIDLIQWINGTVDVRSAKS